MVIFSKFIEKIRRHVAIFLLFLTGLILFPTSSQACLVEQGGDEFACAALYCGQDRGYWSDSQKRCYRSGFIGTHRQTRSNAGSCPGCTVSAFHVVQSDAFAIVGNNGWVATMRYTDAQRRVATGQGTWPASFGAYSGKPFTMTLKRSADAKSFEMQADTPGVGQIIARFAMGPRLSAVAVAAPP